MTELAELAKRLRAHAGTIYHLCGEHTEDSRDLLAAAEVVERSEWRPISGAPNGCVTEDAGCRGESEWFIGLSKFGDVRSIKRLPDSFGYTWCDHDQTYYCADHFTDWMPLPAPPAVKP